MPHPSSCPSLIGLVFKIFKNNRKCPIIPDFALLDTNIILKSGHRTIDAEIFLQLVIQATVSHSMLLKTQKPSYISYLPVGLRDLLPSNRRNRHPGSSLKKGDQG